MAEKQKKMTVFVFGNSAIFSDSLPVKLLTKLRRLFSSINFVHVDPTENWYRNEKELVILDTVANLDKVTVFHTLDAFEKSPRVTPHDYDLYTDLKLLQKMGKLKKVTIIGMPMKQSQQTENQLEILLRSL